MSITRVSAERRPGIGQAFARINRTGTLLFRSLFIVPFALFAWPADERIVTASKVSRDKPRAQFTSRSGDRYARYERGNDGVFITGSVRDRVVLAPHER